MSQLQSPRLYSDLASWYPLVSPPSHYVEEAADLLPTILAVSSPVPVTMLELIHDASWLPWMQEAGFSVKGRIDPWGRDVFCGKRDGSNFG